MADIVQPIVLDIGLDTVSPPLLAKEGSLSDCLNYEVADTIGYRRIDGYENYDGFPNGHISYYLRVRLIATVPADQASIVAGSILYRSNNGLNPVAIGVVLGGPFDTDAYDVGPLQNLDSFVLTEEFLELLSGGFISLASGEGLLLLLGDDDDLGSTFTISTPTGDEFEVSVVGSTVDASSLVTAAEYLENLRTYGAELRALVEPAPAPVAGLYWFDDRLYAAVNTYKVTLVVDALDTQPTDNMRVRWNGTVYYTAGTMLVTEDATNTYHTYLVPVGTDAIVDDNLVQIGYDGTPTGTTWASDLAANGTATNENSEYALLGYYTNPDVSITREFVYLPHSSDVTYSGGTSTSAFGPTLSITGSSYYAVGTDGAVMQVKLMGVTQQSGTWTGNDSAGTAQFIVEEALVGDRDILVATDEIHSEYPTTAGSLVMTIDDGGNIGLLAGTLALDANNTRYQWITANFYGQEDSETAWGVNGAGRGFWVTPYGYGLVYAVDSADLDKPKYVAYHAGSLVYGYDKGSVLRSVSGEPTNFSGADGALEFATGDNVTGLLEMPGDTIAVMGRRSIRKISGTGPSDISMGTIASNSGCFNYTAVMIGQEAVFTGINGITTLQQTAAYGDFSGQRLSSNISNWLRPNLISGFRGGQEGGVQMAYPVRSKNQYRLVLSSGEVVCMTLTQDGPKAMRLSYGLTGETKIPYAWSSEIDADGRERIHVVWDHRPRQSQVIELENGWGFNGVAFISYFDTAHLFFNSGANFGGIEGIRLHGQGYGVATLNVRASGIEQNYDQPYNERIQDISIPEAVEAIYNRFKPITNFVDHANWGLGIKLRFESTIEEGSAETEPSHICQALVLHVRTEGAQDG